MPGLFQVSAKGVYVRDGKALLLEGEIDSGERFWDLPGGRLEQKEDPRDALRREVSEELPGLQHVTVHDLLYAELSWHLTDKCDLIIFYYRIGGDLPEVSLTDEHVGYRWVDAAVVDSLVETTGQQFFDQGMDTALRLALA